MKLVALRKSSRITLLLLITAFTIFFLIRVRAILLPFFLAMAITYVLHPLVDYLYHQKVPRVLAILLVYLILLAILVLFSVFLIPMLLTQLLRLAETLPSYIGQVQEFIHSLQENYSDVALPEGVRVIIDQRLGSLEGQILSLISHIIERFFGLFTNLFNIIIAPVFAFYMLKDTDRIRKNFFRLIPASYKNDIVNLLGDIDRVIGGFIRGQLTVSLIIGILTGVGMRLLGMRFAALLGIFAGIMEFIPYFGPFLGAIPAIAFALLRSPLIVGYVALTFVVIQQIESTVIAPRIFSGRVGLHPLVIIFALLVGQELLGIPGMLIAVPVAGTLRVVLLHIGRHLM